MAERKNFGVLTDALDAPDLIEIQLNSYRDFLQQDVSPSRRKKMGLQAVLGEAFPIESYDGRCALDFVRYDLSEPKMNVLECLLEGETYAAPLHVVFRLKEGEEAFIQQAFKHTGLVILIGKWPFVRPGKMSIVI